jgi:TRAP-type C4-dicarboxylate transport system substrate-binding protein
MAYRSLDEAAFVRSKLAARYEERMAARGFIVLGWCDYGWWQIFSRERIRVPADLRGQKMVVAAAGSPLAEIANSIRVQPVELEPSDFLVSLQTGLVTMVPAPPFFALAGQLYQPAKYMLEIDWAPVAGGIVLTRRTWDQLTPEQQTAVRGAAEEACEKITAQGRATMGQSIETMKNNGLIVQTLDGGLEKQWRDYFEAIYPEIRGNLVPAAEYDDIMSLLREYRAQQSDSAS